LGKFRNINVPIHQQYWDDCRGPNQPAFDKIGQDWIKTNCLMNGQLPIISIVDGYHQIFITIEPAIEQSGDLSYQKPFPFKILRQNWIATSIVCRYTLDNLFNPETQYHSYPRAHVNLKD